MRSCTGTRPKCWPAPTRTIDAAPKHVVSATLDRVDWNAELVRGDTVHAVRQLKRQSGRGLYVGGVTLPLALAEQGLMDQYEFILHPRIDGHGPTPFNGLPFSLGLRPVGRKDLASGAVALSYEPAN